MARRGELHIIHFHRAVLEALGADFHPFPNPDDHPLLEEEMRQTEVEGVDGAGGDGKVVTVWEFPSDAFVRYVMPGIKVSISSWDSDGERKVPPHSQNRYRVPAEGADEVILENPFTGETVKGHDRYVERLHTQPYELEYDVEVRARRKADADALQRHVRRSIRDRSELEVEDTAGERYRFPVFRNGAPSDASDVMDALNRHSGYILSYTVEARLDEWDETESRALTSPPVIDGEATEDPDG